MKKKLLKGRKLSGCDVCDTPDFCLFSLKCNGEMERVRASVRVRVSVSETVKRSEKEGITKTEKRKKEKDRKREKG